ncbi:MAG: type II toxin-antitoxin system RatA family toxin [Betaproteobacteria bacterium]
MAQVIKSVLVAQSAQCMFELVDAVEKYAEFLPWCGGSECNFRDDKITRATLHINYRGIRQSFSTENVKTPPALMQIRLIEGPFRTLEGSWRFTDLNGRGCKVELSLHYEFSSRLLEKLIGPVFGYIANSMVDAFVKRAQSIYG